MSSSPANSPGLGSLAQAARGKQLNQARNILLVVGVLTIAANAVFLAMTRSQVRAALGQEVQKVQGRGMTVDQEKLAQLEESAVRASYLIQGAMLALGVVFVVLGLAVKRYPVPATVLGLVLYVGAGVIAGLLNPEILLQGIIIKILIVAGLIKAVQSAVVYQREMASPAPPEPAV